MILVRFEMGSAREGQILVNKIVKKLNKTIPLAVLKGYQNNYQIFMKEYFPKVTSSVFQTIQFVSFSPLNSGTGYSTKIASIGNGEAADILEKGEDSQFFKQIYAPNGIMMPKTGHLAEWADTKDLFKGSNYILVGGKNNHFGDNDPKNKWFTKSTDEMRRQSNSLIKKQIERDLYDEF